MGRRYRRKRNGIRSVVGDVVDTASRLPWWGALLVGIASYILIALVLGGFIEGQMALQVDNKFHALTEVRLGRLVYVCSWVGIACLIAGFFFAIRNYFIAKQARKSEKSIVAILSKLLGRSID